MKPLCLFLASACLMGQPWTTILSTSRAINWSNAGLPSSFPDGETTSNAWTPPTRTKCGSTLTPSGGDDTTQITSAIAACGNGTYVLLGSGTFLIQSNLYIGGQYGGNNYVTVRGSGPMSTTLSLSSTVSANLGASNTGSTVTLASSPAQGATSVTLSSSSNLPTNGQVVWLQQCDNGISGNPCNTGGNPTDTGGLYWCGLNNVCATDNPGSQYNNSYPEYQGVRVTSVSGATIGFTPGLYQPDWSTTRTVVMTWEQNNPAGFGAGLEDLSISSPSFQNVRITACYACWLKGVRLVNTTLGLGSGGAHNLIANNYLADDTLHEEIFEYSFDSDSLIINNVTQTGFWEGGGSSTGEVFAYNTVNDDEFQHQAGSSFNLFEGNQIIELQDDDTWGTHNLNTFFRNYNACWIEPYNYQPGNNAAQTFGSFARFENSIGNALGSTNPITSSPECSPYSQIGSNSLPTILSINPSNTDSIAASSLMNWGNYAVCTGTNCNAVNYIQNPTSLTGAAATYNNISSPSTTLPASFFMSGSTAPGWWGVCVAWTTFPTSCSSTQTQPYPLNGPGVSSGLAVNPQANYAPSGVAFNNLPIDTSYQVSYTVTSSSWSSGVETLTISGSFPTAPTHGFQFSGASGACIPSSGASYTGRSDGELLTAYPSTTGTISYAIASNPGTSCTGTVKWPDIRQFDERIYTVPVASVSTGGVSSGAGVANGASVRP